MAVYQAMKVLTDSLKCAPKVGQLFLGYSGLGSVRYRAQSAKLRFDSFMVVVVDVFIQSSL